MAEDKTNNREGQAQENPDIAAEFGALGRKLRHTVETAWTSEERHKLQSEIQEGMKNLASEMEKTAKTVRESETGQKVEGKVKQVRDDFESGKVADDLRIGLVSALRGIGAALDKLADGFTPTSGESAPSGESTSKSTEK